MPGNGETRRPRAAACQRTNGPVAHRSDWSGNRAIKNRKGAGPLAWVPLPGGRIGRLGGEASHPLRATMHDKAGSSDGPLGPFPDLPNGPSLSRSVQGSARLYPQTARHRALSSCIRRRRTCRLRTTRAPGSMGTFGGRTLQGKEPKPVDCFRWIDQAAGPTSYPAAAGNSPSASSVGSASTATSSPTITVGVTRLPSLSEAHPSRRRRIHIDIHIPKRHTEHPETAGHDRGVLTGRRAEDDDRREQLALARQDDATGLVVRPIRTRQTTGPCSR